jgi:hypothetical protein
MYDFEYVKIKTQPVLYSQRCSVMECVKNDSNIMALSHFLDFYSSVRNE